MGATQNFEIYGWEVTGEANTENLGANCEIYPLSPSTGPSKSEVQDDCDREKT